MTEDRWRRVVGPAMVALALLGGAAGTGAIAIATAGAWWDPPPCDGGPAALVAAARGAPADGAAPTPWTELAPVLDGAGTLASQRLTIGIGPDEHRLDLPPESFAGGPFGHIVIVGADDGQRSRLPAIDVVAGCAWDVADEAAVVRRATISPDGDDAARDARGPDHAGRPRHLAALARPAAARPADPAADRGGRAVRPHLVDRVRLVGGRRPRRGPVLRRGRLPDAPPRRSQRRARTSSTSRISDRSSASRAITWSCSAHAAVSPARSSRSTSRATVGPWSATRPAGPR